MTTEYWGPRTQSLSLGLSAVPFNKTDYTGAVSLSLSLVIPGAEEAAKDDEFAEMVGVMVGDEEGFA